MKRKEILLAALAIFSTALSAEAQQGFGTSSPSPSSVVDMVASDKGVLLPRVALTDLGDTVTVPLAADALTVFNTATSGTAPNDVAPGYYYWSAAEGRWIRLLNQNDAAGLEPWQVQGSSAKASGNAQGIYQTGTVGVGDFSAAASAKKFEVRGDFKSEVAAGAVVYGTEVNSPLNPGSGMHYWVDGGTGNYRIVSANALSSVLEAQTGTTKNTVSADGTQASMSSQNGANSHSTIRTTGTGNFFMETYNVANDYGSTISLQDDGLRLVHTTTEGSGDPFPNSNRTELLVQKENGIAFDFRNAAGTSTGQYWFPITSGNSGQVMTQGAGNKMVWTTPSSFALANNGLAKNATTNEIELGGTLNRTTVITTRNGATDHPFRFSGNGNTVSVSNAGTEGRITATGTERGSIAVTGGNSMVDIYADNNAVGQVAARGTGSTGLLLRTEGATPLILQTANSERMRISSSGSIGIGTNNPTEKLDHNGIARLRGLPLNGATNAINTTSGGSASASQDQTFTATRTVVADANGVLGYVTGVPTEAGSSRVIVSTGVPGTQDIGNTNMALAVYSNEYIDVHSAWNNNVFTVPANMGGLYIFSMQSSHSHDANAQPSWFTMSLLQKSTDGGNSWSLLLRDTRSGALGSDIDNGNSLYWTGTLNAGDRLRLLYHCNSTASNYVRLGSLTITKLNP